MGFLRGAHQDGGTGYNSGYFIGRLGSLEMTVRTRRLSLIDDR